MRFNKVIFIIGFNLFSGVTLSQSDTLNQRDMQGLKQGYWILYGRDLPEKGYCDSCKVEEGEYKDDRKKGLWLIYHKNGKHRAKASFVDGRPSGYYEKYYENGMLQESGYFANGKFKGGLFRYYENGCIKTEKYYDTKGNDSLPVIHYYNNCDTSMSKYGTIEFKREKSETGLIVDSSFYSDRTYKPKHPKEPSTVITSTDATSLPVGDGGPDGSFGTTYNGFKPNGYNKVFKSDGNIWMDGEFRNSKLWNGKLYIFDADGILIKIEIWKNGAYHSDAEL